MSKQDELGWEGWADEEKCKTCERSWEHECSLCQRLIVSRPLSKHGFNSGAHTGAEHVSGKVGVSEQAGWGHGEQPQDVQASRGLKLWGTNSQRMLVWNVQLGGGFLHFYQADQPGWRELMSFTFTSSSPPPPP